MVQEIIDRFYFPSKKFGALLQFYKDSLVTDVSTTEVTYTIPSNQEWVIETAILHNISTSDLKIYIKDDTTDKLIISLAAGEKMVLQNIDIPIGTSLKMSTDTGNARVVLVLKKLINQEMV